MEWGQGATDPQEPFACTPGASGLGLMVCAPARALGAGLCTGSLQVFAAPSLCGVQGCQGWSGSIRRRGLGAAHGAYYVPGSFARHRMYIILLTRVPASPACQDGTEARKSRVLPEMAQPAGSRPGVGAWLCPLKVTGFRLDTGVESQPRGLALPDVRASF